MVNKVVTAPLRVDLAGGALDIQPIPSELGPTKIVSATIDLYVEGRMTCDDDGSNMCLAYRLPDGVASGSGLGTSGVCNLVWLALISDISDPYELAGGVYSIEQAMGVVGGTQDQYTSAIGGLLELTFTGKRVFYRKLITDKDKLAELSNRLYLIDTGIRRKSSSTSGGFIDDYLHGRNIASINELIKLTEMLSGVLHTLGESAADPASAVGSYDMLIMHLLDEEWRIRQALYPSNADLINSIIVAAKSVADVAIKALGAAGGGYLLMYAPPGADVGAVGERLIYNGCRLIKANIVDRGIVICNNDNLEDLLL